jgi:hypothetical protein
LNRYLFVVSIQLAACLIGATISQTSHAKVLDEKQLLAASLKINRDMDRKLWHRVIKKTPKLFDHCVKRMTEKDPRCITMLRNLNSSYAHLRKFNPNREHIVKAYQLSKSELGVNHFTTVMSRDLYYKKLLFEENYLLAIPLALEIIEAEKASNNDPFEILNRTEQLYALYGLTEQYDLEERALSSLLLMTEDLLGTDDEEYTKVAQALAENYCTQKKYFEFFQFAADKNLSLSCPQR